MEVTHVMTVATDFNVNCTVRSRFHAYYTILYIFPFILNVLIFINIFHKNLFHFPFILNVSVIIFINIFHKNLFHFT